MVQNSTYAPGVLLMCPFLPLLLLQCSNCSVPLQTVTDCINKNAARSYFYLPPVTTCINSHSSSQSGSTTHYFGWVNWGIWLVSLTAKVCKLDRRTQTSAAFCQPPQILKACDLVGSSLGRGLGALLGPAYYFLSLNGTLIEDILVATLLGIIFCGYLV